MVYKDPANPLQDIAIDFWLIWLLALGQMVFFVSGVIDIRYQLGYLIAGSAAVAGILGVHRRRTNWVWPGMSRRGILKAVTSLIGGSLFVFAATSWSSLANPKFFAWGAAVGLIVFCKILQASNVLYFSKRKYAQACKGQVRTAAGVPIDKGQPAQSDDDLLTRFSRVYSTFVVVIFLASFWYSGFVLGNSSQDPTDAQFALIEYRARVYYVTPLQKTLYVLLETGSIVGILSSFVFRIAAYRVEGREKTKAGKASDSVW